MIYIGYLCLFIGASFLDFTKGQTELKKVTLCFLVVISIFFVGLRYYTGADWSGYINYFNTVTWQDNRYQLGYKVLNLLCRSIVDDYHLVQFIASSFFIISVVRFFYKYSKYTFLCIFLFITFQFGPLFMSQVRQSLAIAVLLWGSDFIFKRRLLPWFFVVIIASLFHITAIVCVLFPLLNIRLPNKIRILLCLVPFIIWFSPSLIIGSLEMVSCLPGKIGELVARYLASERFNKGGELSSGLFYFSKIIFSSVVIVFSRPKDHGEIFFVNSLLLSMLLGACTIVFSLFTRVEAYISAYAMIGWVNFFQFKIINKEKNLFFPILFLFIIYFSLPFVKGRLSSKINPITGREANYSYTPYYNVFIHPENANQRKDWNQ